MRLFIAGLWNPQEWYRELLNSEKKRASLNTTAELKTYTLKP